MVKIKRGMIIVFLFLISVLMDTFLVLLKKFRGTLYFPGG